MEAEAGPAGRTLDILPGGEGTTTAGSCVVLLKASAWVAKFGERGPGDEQVGVAWSWGVGLDVSLF